MKKSFALVPALGMRLRRLILALLVAIGFIQASAANANIPESSIDRVDHIRQRLLELDANGEPPASRAEEEPVRVAQWWGNFPNWPNWMNWGNWRNW